MKHQENQTNDTAGQDNLPPLSFSVVIPTIDRDSELERCIQGVLDQDYRMFDIIVVDNSADGHARPMAERLKVRYTREPRLGVSCARNHGALKSTADIVAYIDDDAIPDRKWLSGLLAEFTNPNVMAVAGRTIPLGLETEAEKLSVVARRSAHDRPERMHVDKKHPDWFSISAFGGVGGGMNMAIRRTAFETWQGFDERLGRGTPMYGGEEQYAFFGLVARGYGVAYTPDAIVRHPAPKTTEDVKRRHVLDLAASTAYFTFLMMEEPEFRKPTMRYLIEAIRGTQRPWRGAPPLKFKLVPTRTRIAAFLKGPFLYMRGRSWRPALRFETSPLVVSRTPQHEANYSLSART